MKNMLRSTAAWFSEKVSAKRPLETVPEAPVVEAPIVATAPEPKREEAAVLPLVAPIVEARTPIAPKPQPQPAPQAPAPELIVETPQADLPKLKIVLKASTFYATCPHCESTFNLQQRLVDPRFKRLHAASGLTCPKCEKAVATPTPQELRTRG